MLTEAPSSTVSIPASHVGPSENTLAGIPSGDAPQGSNKSTSTGAAGNQQPQSALLTALADPVFADTVLSQQKLAQDSLSSSSSVGNPKSVSNGAQPSSSAQNSGTTWSSMDGMPRSSSFSWQPSPSDGILQSTQPFLAASLAPPQGPPSIGPVAGSGSFDSSLGRAMSLPPINTSSEQQHARTSGMPQQKPQQQPAAIGGLTPAQQQILQQQLLFQQQQQQQHQQKKLGAIQNGYSAQNVGLANLQAAAIRQQALLRQQQQQQQVQQNNLLLQQALLAQSGALQGNNAALLSALSAQQRTLAAGHHQQQQQQVQRPAGNVLQNNPLNQAAINALIAAQLGNTASPHQSQSQAANLTAQQQLLMSQLRSNSATNLAAANQQSAFNVANSVRGAAPIQHRPPVQLQSEALIAMQRQQAAAAGAGMALNRLPSGPLPGTANGGLTQDQFTAMAQLGLLNKTSGAGSGGLSAQQQAALLSALHRGGGGVQQQRRPAGFVAPSIQQGPHQRATSLGPPQLDASQPNLLATAFAQFNGVGQQQHQLGGMPHSHHRPSGAVPIPTPAAITPSTQRQSSIPSSVGNANGIPTGVPSAGNTGSVLNAQNGSAVTTNPATADPIQTLQDIGRTLAQLNITVEAAVNAGLLGGLSASDVRIVAEAHRQNAELRTATAVGGGGGGSVASTPAVLQQQQQRNGALAVGATIPQLSHSSSSPFLVGPNPQHNGGLGMGMGSNDNNNSNSNSSSNNNHNNHNNNNGRGHHHSAHPIIHSTIPGMSAFTADGTTSAPNPSSPAGSIGKASVSSAPALQSILPGSAKTSDVGDEDHDEVDQLLLEIDEESSGGGVQRAPIDENAIRAKVEEMAKEFDASQYGFFGSTSTHCGSDGSSILGLEPAESLEGNGLVPHSDSLLLAHNFGTKISLNEPGRGTSVASITSSTSQHDTQPSSSSGASTSLFGSSDRVGHDPFGSYLAGLRLGTGF